MTTDKIQSKNINLLFGLVGALGALSIFLSYINQRKHNKRNGKANLCPNKGWNTSPCTKNKANAKNWG